MDPISVFVSTFTMVFIGELGDKTQIATGTGTLANPSRVRIIFFSSILALISVAGLTTFFAGLIPKEYMPFIIKIGGFLLILYGIYLYIKAEEKDKGRKEDFSKRNNWIVFFSNFWVVFIAEMGDKTQVFTLGSALDNQTHLWLVFIAASLALVSVTALTIFGVNKLPKNWINKIQKLGAILMILYGAYMIF